MVEGVKSVEQIREEERLRILQLVSGSGRLKYVHDVAMGIDRLEKPSDWDVYLGEKEKELAEKRYSILLEKHSKQAEAESLHQRAMEAVGKEVEEEMKSVLKAREERGASRELGEAEKAAAELAAKREARRAAEEAAGK